MRVLIEDGPHRGVRGVPLEPSEPGDRIMLAGLELAAAAPNTIRSELTFHEYERQPDQPGDFAQGIEARFRWAT